MLNKVLGFLFGKPPEIFDVDGQIRHKLPREKWVHWENRFKSKEYDWHNHRGANRGRKSKSET